MRNILTSLLILLTTTLQAQVPDSLRFDWNKSGLSPAFSAPTTEIDVTTLGVIPDDGLPDHAALNTALANLPVGGAVLKFPAGNYQFGAAINMPSNCIIRGAGADSTRFVFNLNGAVNNNFNFYGTGSSTWWSLNGPFTRGTSVFALQGASAFFQPGDYIEIRQQNGSWDTNPASWAAYAVGHVSRVDSCSADSVYLTEGIRIDLSATLNPEIREIYPVRNSGLECFRMTRTDSTTASVNFGVYYYIASDCYIRGVESFKSICSHVIAEISSHIDISGNYFHESYLYDGSSTRGYGVTLGVHSVLCRVENNVFRKLRHAMMVKQGANGNVFGYNHSLQPFRSEFPTDFGGDISVHGHYPFANLFEGNNCKNAAIDQAWGPNGPYNTLFRNRIELYGLTISSGSVQSNKQTLVGNDITSTAVFQGMYSLNGSDHLQWGNRVQGTVTPAGTGSLSDSSLYLETTPTFWTGSLPWPSIGIPYTAQANLTPASVRYLSGTQPALCGSAPVTTAIGPVSSTGELQAQYSNGSWMLTWNQQASSPVRIEAFGANGQLLGQWNVNALFGSNRRELNVRYNEGVILFRISGEQTNLSLRSYQPR